MRVFSLRAAAAALLVAPALTCAMGVGEPATTPSMLTLVARSHQAALIRRAAAPSGRALTKAGVASTGYVFSHPSKLQHLHVSWTYDWNSVAPPTIRGVQFVPMLWGSGSVVNDRLRALRSAGKAGTVRDLLGFNEPDSPSQSDLSPKRAIALWPKLEKTGLRLGSPAVADLSDGWLQRFMGLARRDRMRVNFLAVHLYPDWTNPATVVGLRRQLTALHRRYHLPIWVTELGEENLRSWGEQMVGRPSAMTAATYLRRVVTMVDRLSFVHRFAWYADDVARQPGSHWTTLYRGGRLTPLGSEYARLARLLRP